MLFYRASYVQAPYTSQADLGEYALECNLAIATMLRYLARVPASLRSHDCDRKSPAIERDYSG